MNLMNPERLSRENRILTRRIIQLQNDLKEETRKKDDFQSELILAIKKYEDEVEEFKTKSDLKKAEITKLHKEISNKDEQICFLKETEKQLKHQLDKSSQTIQSYEQKNQDEDNYYDEITEFEKKKCTMLVSMSKGEQESQKKEYKRLFKAIVFRRNEERILNLRDSKKRIPEKVCPSMSDEDYCRQNLELSRLIQTITLHQRRQSEITANTLAQPISMPSPISPPCSEEIVVREDDIEEAEKIIGKVLFEEDLEEDVENNIGDGRPEETEEEELTRLRKQVKTYHTKYQNMKELNARERRLEEYSRKFHLNQISELHGENSTLKKQVEELQSVLQGDKMKNLMHSSRRILNQFNLLVSREIDGRRLSQNRLELLREKNERLLDRFKDWPFFNSSDSSSSNNNKNNKSSRKGKRLFSRKYKGGYGSLPKGMSAEKIRKKMASGPFTPPVNRNEYKPVYFKASASVACSHRRRRSDIPKTSTSSDPAFLTVLHSTPPSSIRKNHFIKGGGGKAHLSVRPFSSKSRFRVRGGRSPSNATKPVTPRRGGIRKALQKKRRKDMLLNAVEKERVKKEKLGFFSKSPRFDNPKRTYVFY